MSGQVFWLLFRFLIDKNYSNLWKSTNLSRIVRSWWMSANHVAQPNTPQRYSCSICKTNTWKLMKISSFQVGESSGFFQENRSWGLGFMILLFCCCVFFLFWRRSNYICSKATETLRKQPKACTTVFGCIVGVAGWRCGLIWYILAHALVRCCFALDVMNQHRQVK